MLTAAERAELKRRISEARKAGLGPIARPGHPSRFTGATLIANRGREVILPSLIDYDRRSIRRPAILQALNG